MFFLALNSLHRPLTRTYPSNTHSVLRTPVGCVTTSKTPPTLLRGVPAFCAYHDRPPHVLLGGRCKHSALCFFIFVSPLPLAGSSFRTALFS